MPIELWGDAQQSRSFTWVGDAVEGMIRLMASNYFKPLNIASAETITIENLFELICQKAFKIIAWVPSDGPVGPRSRGSDNALCKHVLDWEPTTPLADKIGETYAWVSLQCLQKGLTKAHP